MNLLLRFLALICLVLLFIFSISNRETMVIRFLSWESIELPAFMLLIFAFLAGAMLTLLWQPLRSVSRKSDKMDRPARRFGRKKKQQTPTVNNSTEATAPAPETGQPESVTGIDEGEK